VPGPRLGRAGLREAGIGKTSLVRTFAASAADRARVRIGVCDDLETPRTLGPFRDMARQAGGPLARALEPVAERDAVFGAAWQELADATTVMIVEDVHWADDATLDVLRYLAWRADELPSVLVLTYRDEEPRDDHPLRRLLGTLARRGVRRLEPRRLSAGAVEQLAAERGLDAGVVLDATGGNPFFVTEVLASPDVEVPATVRDAVLARIAELGEDAQRSLELLSTVPGRVDRWLVDGLLGDVAAELEEAERHGLLEADEAHVRFRHELARRAIERELPSTARLAHNRRALAALAVHPGVELSRLSHHARAAGEAELVVGYGLAAAREAAGAGAFHEALDHYELALRSAQPLPDERRATILEDSVWVLYNLSRFDLAVTRAREVVRLREPLGDEHRLARAATYLAAILTLTDRPEEAIAWARRALELGERTGQRDVVAHSLNYLGYAMLDLGEAGGAAHLRRAVAVACAAHHYEYAQRAYTNLVEGLYRLGRFDELDEPIERGLAYSREYGFASHEYNLEAHRCMLLTLRGRWDEAEAGLRRLLTVEEDPGVLASFGLSALGRLLARRADPDAAGLLERAWGAATRTNSVQAIALAGIARVEAAWLAGDHRAARQLAELPLERTAERYRGELLRYLARSGAEVSAFSSCPPEYELGVQGDWRGAAAAWGALGAPYERALELLALAASRSCSRRSARWRRSARCSGRPGPARAPPDRGDPPAEPAAAAHPRQPGPGAAAADAPGPARPVGSTASAIRSVPQGCVQPCPTAIPPASPCSSARPRPPTTRRSVPSWARPTGSSRRCCRQGSSTATWRTSLT
jgi:tetratricopeptide (TPR) repeat protein